MQCSSNSSTFTRAEKQDHHHISLTEKGIRKRRKKQYEKKKLLETSLLKWTFFYSITNQHQIVCKNINIKFYRGESNWLSPLALLALVFSNRQTYTQKYTYYTRPSHVPVGNWNKKGKRYTVIFRSEMEEYWILRE